MKDEEKTRDSKYTRMRTGRAPNPPSPPRPVLKRLLPPLAIILVLLSICVIALLVFQENRLLDEKLGIRKRIVSRELQVDLDHLSAGLAVALQVMSFDPVMRTTLSKGDADSLLERFQRGYEILLKEHQINHFSFLSVDRTFLLRFHSPERSGDVDNHYTTLQAARTGGTASGIEVEENGKLPGQTTLTMRVVQPVFAADALIGYAVLGKEIEYLWKLTEKRFPGELAVIIRKKNSVDNRVIYSSRPLPAAFADLAGQAVHDYSVFKKTIHDRVLDGKDWRISTFPLRDASGQDIGALLLMLDVTAEKELFQKIRVQILSSPTVLPQIYLLSP